MVRILATFPFPDAASMADAYPPKASPLFPDFVSHLHLLDSLWIPPPNWVVALVQLGGSISTATVTLQCD